MQGVFLPHSELFAKAHGQAQMRSDTHSAMLVMFLLLLCCCTVLLVAARHGQFLELTSWWSVELMAPDFDGVPRFKYDWSLSTEENYRSDMDCQLYGNYAAIRKTLDYSYHSNYTKERQLLQDKIIDHLLSIANIVDPTSGEMCATPSHPWIAFTAGCMGAGKSWTIRHLSQRGLFPLHSFVTVDPDDIRHHLPEFKTYALMERERAGEWTRKEAGMISEILTLAALEKGHNVLVDGSLRDSLWYESYFSRLKRDYAPLRIAILHITAPSDVVYARAASRAHQTGRVIPRATLEESLLQVPKSLQQLSPMADFYAQLHNAEDAEIRIQAPAGLTWQAFRKAWIQSCALGGNMSEGCRYGEANETCLGLRDPVG